jgi:glyoxylase-like metal-dependent hydrolase (beta-lactamase superfamily II)
LENGRIGSITKLSGFRDEVQGRVRDLKGHAMTQSPIVAAFWDAPTGSWQYVFHDPATMKGAIVDPVWNFDPLSGATATRDAQKLLDYVRDTGIEVEWVLDTHPHADHFSAGVWLKQKLGAKTGIGDTCRQGAGVVEGYLSPW